MQHWVSMLSPIPGDCRTLDGMAKISDLLAAGRTTSFEFFPPKDAESARSLEKTLHELEPIGPDYISVTYGAGGSTRELTRDLVVDLNRNRSYPAMPHLTCMGHTRADLVDLLEDYRANDIGNILALAGDPPADGSEACGELTYATELIEIIREVGDFSIGVAAFPELHPRSDTTRVDRRRLADKLEVADFGITQFFFDDEPYLRMVDDLAKLGCTKPVVPGIIAPTTPQTIRRFATMNGSRVPPGLWNRLEAADPHDRHAIAVDFATNLGAELLEAGAPGIHFYTLNKSEATLEIHANLGL